MKKQKISGIVVIVCCIIVILICIMFLFNYEQQKQKQADDLEKLRTEVLETEEELVTETEMVEETEINQLVCEQIYDFEGLHNQNEDIYAWITVPGTKVDYPILQCQTDNYYLDYNMDHTKGYPGCIYSNQCTARDFSDEISVFYGHNMKNGSMFGSLHSFEDNEFFQNNRQIIIYTETNRYIYEIFAAVQFTNVYIPAEYDVTSVTDKENFIADIKDCKDDGISHVVEDTEITDEDKLIVLSTCISGHKQNRYLIVGKLIETMEAK